MDIAAHSTFLTMDDRLAHEFRSIQSEFGEINSQVWDAMFVAVLVNYVNFYQLV